MLRISTTDSYFINIASLILLAYLNVSNYNVILVDWSKAAGNLWYWKVARSVPLVAQRVTELIDFLERKAGLDPSKTKVVGHSLGGHVVGLAARNAKSKIAEAIGKSSKNHKKRTNQKKII